ncbi:hypothetical protein [Cellulomonas terrae]|uniref:Uncharacterized protein n=1 Tax=Cellulomonas terrae TaxID=311234 RepID=A0A511JLX3_9CELL|nr:hypothetical protein [Cellulomonas terrae]GEL98988.1 hypothetical protein CTE05_25350 [Cellulomonas terrae]
MPAALTSAAARSSLEAPPEPAPVIPARVRTAPVAVAGVATGLRRGAEVVDPLDRATVRRAAQASRAAPLAPLRRQAVRAGTVRRMRAATADAAVAKPTPLPTGWKVSVALSTQERSARDQEVEDADGLATHEGTQQGLSGPQLKSRVDAARQLAAAKHAKDPAPYEANARSQKITAAWLSGAQGTITSHWELLLQYGDEDPPLWVKIDLTSADGYRVIWSAGPRSLIRELPLRTTVGDVLDTARTVASRHTTYFNPDTRDEDLPAPRYSCQHFVAEIAAVYGETLHPVVKQ